MNDPRRTTGGCRRHIYVLTATPEGFLAEVVDMSPLVRPQMNDRSGLSGGRARILWAEETVVFEVSKMIRKVRTSGRLWFASRAKSAEKREA